MPFDSNKELSDKVRGTSKLSERKKRQWRHVFDSCYEKHGDKETCYKQAWGAVKNTASCHCLAKATLAVARDVLDS